MTTKSPAETFGQQAEAVAGKRMSWTDTAARLAPLGAVALGALGYAENRAQGRQEFASLDRRLRDNVDITDWERADPGFRQRRAQWSARTQRALDSAREFRDLRRAVRVVQDWPANLFGPTGGVDVGLVARAATPGGRPGRLTGYTRGARSNYPHGDL